MTDEIHTCHFDCLKPDCVRAAREQLFEARELLADWQAFGGDFHVWDRASRERLDALRARTKELQKP